MKTLAPSTALAPTAHETAHAARVAFLAAAAAHVRIMARRAQRLSGPAPQWSAGALERLLVDVLA